MVLGGVKRRARKHVAHLSDAQMQALGDEWAVSLTTPEGVTVRVVRHVFLKEILQEEDYQYHNFFGDWTLCPTEPLFNGRPHYVHNTLHEGLAHMYHIVDPNFDAPRWVIGAQVGTTEGWAVAEAESDESFPEGTWMAMTDSGEWQDSSFHFEPLIDKDGCMDDEEYDQELEMEARLVEEVAKRPTRASA